MIGALKYNTIDELIEIISQRRSKVKGHNHVLKILDKLDHPERTLQIIQIVGTNGKGSTTNFLRAILQTQGYKVGTFTSPHLTHYTDRIRINDISISLQDLEKYALETHPFWDAYGALSFFEISFLIALLYLKNQECDVVIIETGLGGKHDVTNVLNPNIIGLTNVSLDHIHILGNSLEEITHEKAAIFKSCEKVYCSENNPTLKGIIDSYSLNPVNYIELPSFTYASDGIKVYGNILTYVLSKHPEYQIMNAELAIHLAKAFDDSVSNEVIRFALKDEIWAGRYEYIRDDLLIDGAHNPAGAKALVNALKKENKKAHLLYASVSDKEYKKVLNILSEVAKVVYVTDFEFQRSLDVETLNMPYIDKSYHDPYEAMDELMKLEGLKLITGSLYFISIARAYIKENY